MWVIHNRESEGYSRLYVAVSENGASGGCMLTLCHTITSSLTVHFINNYSLVDTSLLDFKPRLRGDSILHNSVCYITRY